MGKIELNALNDLRVAYEDDEKARVVRNALTKNDINTISRVFEAEKDHNRNVFSINIKTMKSTNQRASGRCWIFSAMNVLRESIAKKYNIKEFELSQNYIAFYDKLEKINWFMDCVEKEKDKPLGDEVNRFLLSGGVEDGGQWNMLVSLVKKYGICPKDAYPETFQASNTRYMNSLINERLRKYAADLHRNSENAEVLKKECLKECYGVLASSYGLPPKEFTFEYYDKDDVYHAEYNVTPLEFYEKYLAEDIGEYISVINGPTKDKPYHHIYTVKYLGNVVDGEDVLLLNVPMEELKESILKQMKDGSLVWFGCDCVKEGDREIGLWDDAQFDYESTFDMNLKMSKEDILDTRHSAMNHAMVFTGVNLVDDKPNRWKIENSWGDECAHKGYFVATDTWFDKYVYVAAIHKKYLSNEALAALDSEVIELEPWDPFGTLAD